MPATAASRARADRLRDRIATIRRAHRQAVALARMTDVQEPPESHLGLLGVADFFPALVASQEANRHLLGALEHALPIVERELARGWPPPPPAARLLHDDPAKPGGGAV